MADILSVPAEFSTIVVKHDEDWRYQAYLLLPRPPLGMFMHHAVQTFAKTCGEGRIGLNWPNHLIRARETWRSLSPEELLLLRQAVDIDKQCYDEREELVGRGRAEYLLHLLEETKIRKNGVAPSAFDLFKNSPETRSRLCEVNEGLRPSFYRGEAFIWLWARIDDDEKSHWRQEAQRRLEVRNNDRKMKGEEELLLDTEPQSRGKPKRIVRHNINDRKMKGEEVLLLDTEPQSREEPPSRGKPKRLGTNLVPPDDEGVVADDDDDDHANDQKSQSVNAEIDSVENVLQWAEDDNLTADEKKLLEAMPPDLRRWDHFQRAARNAYTLYYADRLTTAGSPHIGKDPHCSTTRAEIHAEWEAADGDTHEHFENLARADNEQFDRQSKERTEWQTAWGNLEHQLLLPKVIDRWHPNSSFDDGQNRIRSDIPRRHHPTEEPPILDFELPCLGYPVIRTDYSNSAIYDHLRHDLLNNMDFPVSIDMTFYDGMEPSSSVPLSDRPSFAKDDPRAADYEWCKTNLENKSVDDLKASFGELYFHRKDHMPIYTFGGHRYAIVIDSQSMKDGTSKFVSLSAYDNLHTRPDHDSGPDGAWKQDPKKEWYLASRVQASDVVLQLVNLDITKASWCEYVEHNRADHGLDLFSDSKAQRWRGWQLAIEYVFGDQALVNVVGEVIIPDDAFLPFEDEDE